MNSVVRTATSLASEAGRFSQMLTTQIVEKTKEVGIPAHLYETAEEKTADILPGLNSKFDKEKLDAMKRLVALMSKGNNVSEFFPHVIKNVASQSFDVRKLVYIYLLRYAEQEPDLALLSINTFQKDMTDKNPLIRAMALRVMSSIRVPVIAPIITLALRKGVSDLSPYVRKAAANAIPKCFSLDPMQKDCLIELLVLLLNDKSTVVLGTAVSSLNRICPDRYDLIHKHYHKLCRLMIDCDEWGQIEIMTMIMRYVRVNFLPPVTEASTALSESPAFKSSYRDNDHAQFISSIKPLLHSRNISVVLTVITAISTTGSMADLNKAVPFLIRLVRYSRENQYAVLLVILSICKTIPGAFSEFCHCFAVFHGDIPVIRDLKLEIMECIVCKENMEFVLGEFKAYVTNADEKLCIRTIQVWGRLASRLPFVIDQSLKTLVALVSEPNAAIVGEVIIVLRRLLQARSDLDAHNAAETSLLLTVDTKQSGDKSTTTTKVIRQLFQSYDSITVSMAKASVLWLIGHYVTSLPLIAPDALRVAVKSFVTEGEVVKLQTLNLAASVAVNLETCKIHMEMGKAVDTSMQVSCDSRVLNVVRLCFEYVLELARYDLNFDVRDRARFLAALVHRPLYLYDDKDHEKDDLETRYATLCRLVQILAGSQGVSKPADPFDALAAFRTGTLSHAVGTRVDGYTDLPPWTTVPSNASLRVVVVSLCFIPKILFYNSQSMFIPFQTGNK
ncbi:hypothetical protein, variant 2 [Batrachochytrium dendrobatidis JEL423]|uniref:Clathrin/coatomer adaptor adaptin-like N-terminal domain-containing protein n=1 Tax=Batrachochytrium dendrobatidis (strain JEL423) TaxID=403673 RepID=A0A177WJZ4_BATDL|nr:hypothetical protein, variant 2 [Batrachochytrium dendrobatidis JEL423]